MLAVLTSLWDFLCSLTHPLPGTEHVLRASDPWTAVILTVVELLAYFLLKPKIKSIHDDSKSPLAQRGSYCQYVIGLEPIQDAKFLWRGDRKTKKEKVDGGKGDDSAKQKIYYEAGWHGLCFPGPGQRLYEIRENGELIWSGPIDRVSHPSGSTVSAGKQGSFKIYWGEPDQPIDAFLSDPSRVDVASRWPFLMHVVWTEKRLGTSPLWGRLQYLVEVGINQQILASTPASINQTVEDTPIFLDGVRPIMANVAGPPGTNYFIIQRDVGHILPLGDLTNIYKPGTLVDFKNGQGATPFGPGVFPCLKCEYTPGLPTDPFPADTNKIFLACNVDQVSAASGWKGDLQAIHYVEAVTLEAGSTGINLIHGLAQYLFAPWPYGRNLPTTFYSMASFEDGAVICNTERIPGHLVANDGEAMKAMIGIILQECGFFLSFDVRTGLWTLVALRYADPTLVPVIPASGELELPAIERDHRARPSEKISFTFRNKDEQFAELPIVISDDGQASIEDVTGIKRLALYIPIDQLAASKYAERRAQEVVAGTALRQTAGFESRLLMPGDPYKTTSRPYVLRLIKTASSPLKPDADLQGLKDNYGALAVDGTYVFDLPPSESKQPENDLHFKPVEVPSALTPGKVKLFVARIRAHAEINKATIWISPDGVNYYQKDDDLTLQTGGLIGASWPNIFTTYPFLEYWENGPLLNYEGPDIDVIPDLSSDPVSWHNGKNVMILDNGGADPEICFFRNLTPTGAGQVRVDGVLRGRFNTPVVNHALGTVIFLVSFDDGLLVDDAMLLPKSTVWVKTQPATSFKALSLAQVAGQSIALVGQGIVPDTPSCLRTANMRNDWAPGADIPLRWNYVDVKVPNTGAGDQPAGLAHGSSPVAPATFTLRILGAGGVEKKKIEGIPTNAYTLTNADLVTAFITEPSDFTVELAHVLGGYASAVVTIKVIKV